MTDLLQEHVVGLIMKALEEAGVTAAEIDCIAYTKVIWHTALQVARCEARPLFSIFLHTPESQVAIQ